MDEMNATESVERLARENERMRVILLAEQMKTDGKTLDDLIGTLKAQT